MSIEVWFEQPPGVRRPSLQFVPGESVRVAGRIEVFNIGAQGWPVTVDLFDGFAPMQWLTETGSIPFLNLGEFYVDITLPSVITLGTLRVVADGGLLGSERAQIIIGIGETPPPPKLPLDWPRAIVTLALIVGVVLVAATLAPTVSSLRRSR